MPNVERLFALPEFRNATDLDVTLVGHAEAVSVNAFVDGISQLFVGTDTPRDWKPIAADVLAGAMIGRGLGQAAGALLFGLPLAGLIAGPIGAVAGYWSAIRREKATVPVALASVVEDVKRIRGLDVQIREVATDDSAVAAVLGVYRTGSAVITVNANLSGAWKRFVIAKELAHLMVEPEGPGRVSTPFDLEALLHQIPVREFSAPHHEIEHRQTLDRLLALEILFPQALRGPAFASVAEGRTSMWALSEALILPPQMVEMARVLTINAANDAPWADTTLAWRTVSDAMKRSETPALEPDQAAARPVERLLAQGGGSLSLSGISDKLVCSLDEARALVAGGEVFAIRGPDTLLAPADQFLPDGTVVPGLKAILTRFVDRHPVITLQFLVTPDSALDGQSPLQALALGGRWAEAVERLARAHQGDGFA